ncbi:hypothetical protein [Aquamicrobium sp. LC103]|uniref:hypothetical protein n=1 Tax=Aquamicrobium sp. LC103 TaxID=1120658 RepID=UPI00063EAB3D|nr:hypothetical protein [Aquamicrobium sp. LC103]TKT79307.1 hypothetical protein XW59_010310 [Aquamicrobium sp. LC103]
MKRIFAAASILLACAGQASATASIGCAAADDRASFDLTIGNVPVLAVVGAEIDAAGETWSLAGNERSIRVGQAFETPGEMRIDFTDANVEAVVAEIRLFKAAEGDDAAMAGTLKIAGKGAWAVTCVGP